MNIIDKLNNSTSYSDIELAKELSLSKDYIQAEETLKRVLNKELKNGYAWYLLGNALVALNRCDQAYESFLKALENGYVEVNSLFATALLAKTKGDKPLTVSALERLCDLDKKNLVSKRLLISELFEQSNMEKVISESLDLQSQIPDDYYAYHTEFSALVAQNKYQLSLEKLQKIYDVFCTDRQFQFDYAFVLFLSNKYQQAWDYLKASSINKNSLEYLQLKSKIVTALKLKEEAIAVYKDMYDNYKLSFAAVNLSALYITDNEIVKAEKYLSMVLATNKKELYYYIALYMYAQCQELLNKSHSEVVIAYENAISVYESVYKRKPVAHLMELAAECYKALGDTANEIRCRAVLNKSGEIK